MDEDQLDEVQENAEDAEDAQAQGDTEDAEDAQAQGDTGNAAPQAIPISPTVGPRVAAPKRPSLADWQPAKDAPGYFNDLQDTPPASAKSSSLWKTAGNAAWVSTMQMGSDALGAADVVARQITSNPTVATWARTQQDALESRIQNYVQSMPADQQMALHASVFGGGTDKNGEHIPTPGEVGYLPFLASSLGSLIPAPAIALVGSAIAAAALPETVATLGGAATAGGIFAVLQGGGAMRPMVDTIDKTKDADFQASSPAYKNLRTNGMSEDQAKATIINQIAPSYVAKQAALGFATGVGVGGILMKGAVGAAGRSLLQRMVIGGTEGAATMAAQQGGGDALQQGMQVAAGLHKEYDPHQTALALASGALTGAVVGGVGGALHGAPHAPETPEEPPPPATTSANTTGVAADTTQALTEALSPPEPTTTAVTPVAKAPTVDEATDGTPVAEPAAGVTASPPAPGITPEASQAPQPTTAEPTTDIAAQVRAMMDPANPKDSVFIAKGTPVPPLPAGAKTVVRKEGTLFTTNADKAKLFRTGPIDDAKMASVLGYPEAKGDAIQRSTAAAQAAYDKSLREADTTTPAQAATAEAELRAREAGPKIVQGRDAAGNVVHESVASPQGVSAAREAAAATVPGGTVHELLPQEMQERRAEKAPTVVDEAAHQAETPTPAQAEAGNYQKGHVDIGGLDVSVETPRGEVRKGPVDETTGMPKWTSPPMPDHYGYIRRTEGADGDHVDVTLGPHAHEAENHPVYVIDQKDPTTGKFDEHKSFIGFASQADALQSYHSSFSDHSGYQRVGAVTPMSFDKFKEWAKSGDTKKALTYKQSMGDVLRGRRAAEKARMAKPGEAVQGAAYTEMATPTADEPPALMNLLARPKPTAPPRTAAAIAKSREIQEVRAAEAGRSGGTPRSVEDYEQSTGEGGGSEGVTDYSGGSEGKTRSAATTDLKRKGDDALQDMLAGTKTPQEAHDAFGPHPPQARWANFSEFLEEQIQHAESPEAMKDYIAKAEAIQRMEGATRQARAEATKALNRSAVADTDRIQRMKDALEELRDPVGKAADEEGSSHASRYADVQSDPRVNHVVTNALRVSETTGMPLMLHDLLHIITKDPLVLAEMAPYRALATRLLRLAPNVRVRTVEQARADGVLSADDHAEFYGNGAKGLHVSNSDASEAHIVIDPRQPGTVQTVLHEAMHAVTANYLDALHETSPHYQILQAIGRELAAHEGEPGVHPDRLDYALSNVHELHTMLMTDAKLQQWAATLAPSTRFQADMARLGYSNSGSRTVWQTFTQWVGRALGLPRNSGSVLDHVLRPLQDITDHAAKYNEALAPTREAISHALPNFRDAAEAALSRADLPGIGDKIRRVVNSLSTSDSLVARFKAMFDHTDGNSLENWRTTTERVAARSKEFNDRYHDRVESITQRIHGLGPEHDVFAKVVNEAGYANAQLGPKADNSHLTTAAEKDALSALQDHYNALSPKAKALYEDARALQAAMSKEERDARLSGMIRHVLPDATDDQRKAIMEAGGSQAKLDAFAADPDHSDIATKFGADWVKTSGIVRGIAKLHKAGFVQGDYFPLRRFGDYVVHYGERDKPSEGAEMFERRTQADARRAELVKSGVTDVSQVLDKRASKLRDVMPNSTVDELSALMKKRGDTQAHIDSVREMLSSIALQHATQSQGARIAMRRRGVMGASLETERVFAHEFLASSSRVGYLEHGAERLQAIEGMRKQVDRIGETGTRGEQIKANSVLHEIEQRMPSGDDASGVASGIARRASTLGYVTNLMSFSHIFTSTAEAHMNSLPILGARHGTARAGLELARALKDLTPALAGKGAGNVVKSMAKGMKAADWNLSTVARDRLIAGGMSRANAMILDNQLNAGGLIDHTAMRELQRIASPSVASTTVGKWWGKFMNLNMAAAHAADVTNKYAIATAAFRMELAKNGGDAKAAAKYAEGVARQAMPNYNLANKNRFSTSKGPLGAFAAPITQFKQYGFHMYSMMGSLVHTWMQGASKAERNEARNAFLGILATHTLMAGTFTLIADPLRYIMGAYDAVTGAAKPHDYTNDLRNMMSDEFGPELGGFLARGAGEVAGAEWYRRIGLSNLLEMPELKSFDKAGVFEMMATALFGASGEDAATMAGGLMKGMGGDVRGMLMATVPRLLRDPLKAYGLATEGAKTQAGKTVLTPDKLSTSDIAYQAAGFTPTRVDEARTARYAIEQRQEEIKNARSKLTQAFVAADADGRSSAMTNIRAFNADPAHRGMTITTGELMQALQAKRKAAAQAVVRPGTFGLALPKKASNTLQQEGRFANVQ